jgi:hypothetical protein
LKRAGYDLDVWRKRCHISKEEFALLDADGKGLSPLCVYSCT